MMTAKTYTKFDSNPDLSSSGQWVISVLKETSSQLSSGSLIKETNTSLGGFAKWVRSDGGKSHRGGAEPSRLRSTKPSKRLLKFRSKAYRVAFGHENISNRVAVQVRLLRESAGLSQAELAEKIGTKQSAIARMENVSYGKLSISMLERIAEFFDVAPWVEFISHSTLLRRTADLSAQALLPLSYETEFDASGEPNLNVRLAVDNSPICLTNYVIPDDHQTLTFWAGVEGEAIGTYLK